MRSFFYAKEVHTMPNYDEMDDIYDSQYYVLLS